MRFAVHHYGFYVNMDPPSVSDTADNKRDLYWWCSGYANCDIYNDAACDDLVTFCEEHAVSAVYIDAPAIVALTPPTGDQQILIDLIGRLADISVETHLIFGEYSWALADNHDEAVETATNAVRMVNYYGNLTEVSSLSEVYDLSTAPITIAKSLVWLFVILVTL